MNSFHLEESRRHPSHVSTPFTARSASGSRSPTPTTLLLPLEWRVGEWWVSLSPIAQCRSAKFCFILFSSSIDSAIRSFTSFASRSCFFHSAFRSSQTPRRAFHAPLESDPRGSSVESNDKSCSWNHRRRSLESRRLSRVSSVHRSVSDSLIACCLSTSNCSCNCFIWYSLSLEYLPTFLMTEV